ncbi:tryptophan synthase subunit alpha [Gloeomargarita lithophora Alchichica-D10]|uniref:Tryptophan synthase alpha chain n=1 Tax=Gloeomargarita lithophora Alchichica-D10 TaxID=1188229 RepID=A0A1J0ADI6_9CYAN|nr:tryptophan synthase subunit alpha [Gloeomargarita lithophora]APB33976.1 tryptophan synthase subunit alpha [Gloeomargarita lithophora Alchichica-D10]
MPIAISEQFRQLKSQSRCALIPFITAGDPDLRTTAQALQTLDQAGADIIELGVPYSDPLADGPVIQAAATRALQGGTTLPQVLELVQTVAPQITAPIVLFTYYNPILNWGIESFLQTLAQVGVRGLVVPDLPLEEAPVILTPAPNYGIELTLLAAPTSPPQRLTQIAQQSQGFIYLVSVTGVTGVRQDVSSKIPTLLAHLRQVTDKPIGVGFGVSQPEQARQIRNWGANGVIVGSAFVKRLHEQGLMEVQTFCQQLRQALDTKD